MRGVKRRGGFLRRAVSRRKPDFLSLIGGKYQHGQSFVGIFRIESRRFLYGGKGKFVFIGVD